jgi:cell division protein FtsI (penicillin-binding protein 3)
MKPLIAYLSDKNPWLVGAMAALIAGLLIANVWKLKQATPPAPAPMPERAAILDRDGNTLAANEPAYSLWMDPNTFLAPCEAGGCQVGPQHASRIAPLLAALADTPPIQASVRAKLSHGLQYLPSQRFIYLAYHVPPAVVAKLKPLQLPGLNWESSQKRLYPEGPLFAHALGFTVKDPSGHGLEGLEWVADNRLRTEADNAGKIAPLSTTLDSALQTKARNALQATLRPHPALAGAVVIADARTGAVLSMVSAPDFDPNDETSFRNPLRQDRILNNAVANAFPLEGLIAPLLVAQALNEHVVTPETRFAQGSTVAELVRNPTPTVTAVLLRHMQPQTNYAHLDRLGFGLDLRMPGISQGVYGGLTDWRDWTPAIHATLGHEVRANLMQILQAYQPIATDGRLRRLRLIATPDADNCPPGASPSQDCARVVSPENAATLRRLMAADGPHATIGTLSALPHNHSQPGTRAIRIGMTPTDAPRYLVGVLLHHRTGGKSALMPAATALFNTLMDQIDQTQDRAFAHGRDTRLPSMQATQAGV